MPLADMTDHVKSICDTLSTLHASPPHVVPIPATATATTNESKSQPRFYTKHSPNSSPAQHTAPTVTLRISSKPSASPRSTNPAMTRPASPSSETSYTSFSTTTSLLKSPPCSPPAASSLSTKMNQTSTNSDQLALVQPGAGFAARSSALFTPTSSPKLSFRTANSA
jgi:hypothetical protein